MRICLIGEYSDIRDEAQRVTAFYFAENLGKLCQVLTLHIWEFTTPAFWKKLRAFNPHIIHYVPGMSIKTLILMKIISLYCKNARTAISAMRPCFSYLSAWVIPLLKPDLILTQSCETERKLQSLGCRTQFLPGGVDTEKFSLVSYELKRKLRERYGIDDKNFIVLHVGSVKPGRGVKLLAELQEKEGIQIIIVGPTSVGIHQNTRQQLEEPGCLVWTNYFKNIEEIYALADCYVYPTVALKDYFGKDIADSAEMPLSVLEAMSCNLPIITTRFGALPRVFTEGNGFLFAKPEEIAGNLGKIKKGELEIKTREKVLPYSWNNITRNLEGIYRDLRDTR